MLSLKIITGEVVVATIVGSTSAPLLPQSPDSRLRTKVACVFPRGPVAKNRPSTFGRMNRRNFDIESAVSNERLDHACGIRLEECIKILNFSVSPGIDSRSVRCDQIEMRLWKPEGCRCEHVCP
jgi:hypothetical protein